MASKSGMVLFMISLFLMFFTTLPYSEAKADGLVLNISGRNMKKTDKNTTQLRSSLVRSFIGAAYEEVYVVEIFIGTPFVLNYLILDTGSDFLWLECATCDPCFENLEYQPYDRIISASYIPIEYTDPRCRGQPGDFRVSDDGNCLFYAEYEPGEEGNPNCSGPYSMEIFGFRSIVDEDAPSQTLALDFGCAEKINNFGNFDIQGNIIAGIMGLGKGLQSIVNQISSIYGGPPIFSYCLLDYSRTEFISVSSQLRFGTSVLVADDFHTIPFLDAGYPTLYYLNLIDISFGAHRMQFPANMFVVDDSTLVGGCIIDSGSTITYFIGPAYDQMISYIRSYFDLLAYEEIEAEKDAVCYAVHSDVDQVLLDVPTLTFHFQEADFVVLPRQVVRFYLDEGNFCLNIGRSDKMTTLGAAMQIDYRIVYDLEAKVLKFKMEKDCSEDI